MGLNPVESPEFFRFTRQLHKLSNKCEDHIFIWYMHFVFSSKRCWQKKLQGVIFTKGKNNSCCQTFVDFVWIQRNANYLSWQFIFFKTRLVFHMPYPKSLMPIKQKNKANIPINRALYRNNIGSTIWMRYMKVYPKTSIVWDCLASQQSHELLSSSWWQ